MPAEDSDLVTQEQLEEALVSGYNGRDNRGTFVWCHDGTRCHSCTPEHQCETEDEPDYPSDEEDDYSMSDINDDAEIEESSNEQPFPIRADAPMLYLPNLIGRKIRLMSFEQEIGNGSSKRSVASRLYDRGFAPDADVRGYGSSGDVEHGNYGDGQTFAHVENDGSCGGEIIYSKLDLNDTRQAERFESAIGEIRELIRTREISLTFEAGFHIHVGIQGFGMSAIENLYHVHNYLEDFLFRIGSANWSCHRDEHTGSGYSEKTRKGMRGAAEIGRRMASGRYALNLSNYLASRSHCRCGAFEFANWEDCTCNLRKPTVEFRWPNATANFRKIHAFAATIQSLVSLAENAPKNAFQDLPAMEYSSADETGTFWAEETYKRIAFIGENLIMTKEERDSLAYCVASAPFGTARASMAQAVRSLPAATHELRSLERTRWGQ